MLPAHLGELRYFITHPDGDPGRLEVQSVTRGLAPHILDQYDLASTGTFGSETEARRYAAYLANQQGITYSDSSQP